MYHCHVSFYLAGRPCRAFEIAKEMQPLEYFTHEFVWSGEFEEALAGQANVVFANLEGLPGEEALRILSGDGFAKAELILLADSGQIPFLKDILPRVQDLWPEAMSEEEIRFRFLDRKSVV